MTVKLDYFDYDLVENYYTRNLNDNDFWMFGSFANETQQPTSTNTEKTARDFLAKTVFGVKLTESDFAFMIRNITWQQGVVYTAYDDQAVMSGTNFYTVIEPEIETGEYRVFKCISNNAGSPSTVKPVYETSISDGIHAFSDGYIWKYMGHIAYSDYRKFAASGYVPIAREAEIEAVATDGIYSILVMNPTLNNGYEKLSGIVREVVDVSATEKQIVISNLTLDTGTTNEFTTPDYYKNRSLYVQAGGTGNTIGSDVFEIVSSNIINNSFIVRVFTPVGGTYTIKTDDIVDILPTVRIDGDGTGAVAVAAVSAGKITSVRMLSYGSGYTRASATVVGALFGFFPNDPESRDVAASLKVVISPKGGHGSNIYSELKCRHLGISATITSIDNENVPSVGSYAKVGLVKSPSFTSGFTGTTLDNRVVLTSSDNNNAVTIGSVITQGNVSGILSEKRTVVPEVGDPLYKFYITDYQGAYSETFSAEVGNNTITTDAGIFEINTVDNSPYVDGSGDVLFISDLTPITRTADRFEQIRIVIDF